MKVNVEMEIELPDWKTLEIFVDELKACLIRKYETRVTVNVVKLQIISK